jgi:hypothetical protein
MTNESDQWTAAARPGLDDRAAHLRREGPRSVDIACSLGPC